MQMLVEEKEDLPKVWMQRTELMEELTEDQVVEGCLLGSQLEQMQQLEMQLRRRQMQL